MSRLYSIDVIIGTSFNLKMIEHVLEKGVNYGFIYYESIYSTEKIITPGQAALKLYSIAQGADYDEESCIFTNYQDTFFILILSNDMGNLSVHMGNFSYKWENVFSNSDMGYFFDFARYIRLLLAVCKDFPIVSIETAID